MYAFLSHISALDVLRTIENDGQGLPLWPSEARELPRHYNSVTTQRMYKEFAAQHDPAKYGITRTPVDLLVPKASQRSKGAQARFHAWKGNVPVNSMLRLEESLFVSKPEFVLLQVAGWHSKTDPIINGFARELKAAREVGPAASLDEPVPYDDPFAWDNTRRLVDLVLVAMELMGTYRLAAPGGTTRYGQQQLLTFASVEQFMRGVGRAYGKNRLDTALSLALPHSASPMETALYLLLCLPERYGGFGLPRPKLNRELPVKEHERLWDGGASITPDLLWADAKLIIEYDSNEMHGGLGPIKLAQDATRANVLSALGYTVLRVTTRNIQSPAEVERIAWQVASKLGVELAEPSDALRIRRGKLHALLMRQ